MHSTIVFDYMVAAMDAEAYAAAALYVERTQSPAVLFSRLSAFMLDWQTSAEACTCCTTP